MPRFERPFRSIEEFHETQLDDFETMFRSGVAVAIPAALHYCAEYGLGAPAWLAKASADFLCIKLQLNSPKKKRGRAANLVARYCQDMIHFARWDEVDLVLEQRKDCRREIAELRALPKVPRLMLKEQGKALKRLGRTLDDAFECASENLARTKASGGWDTMRKSYRRVERCRNDPTQATRWQIDDKVKTQGRDNCQAYIHCRSSSSNQNHSATGITKRPKVHGHWFCISKHEW